MEIDPAFFAQRIAMLAILAGFIGGLLFVLVHGAVIAISDRLRASSRRLDRIAAARSRASGDPVAIPRSLFERAYGLLERVVLRIFFPPWMRRELGRD